MKSFHSRQYGFMGLAFLSAALFGASTPASKPLLDHFSEFQLAGLLYLGAAIGTFPLFLRGWKGEKRPTLDRKNFLRLSGAVVCGGILGPVFLLIGLNQAHATSVSMWLNLEAAATAVLGFLFFKDHLGKLGWFGVLFTVGAGALLAWGEPVAGFRAGLWVALGCLCWGFDNHFTALIDGLSPAESTFWKGLVAGVVNLGIGAALVSLPGSTPLYAAAIGIGILSYGASIVLYILSAQHIGAVRAQLVFSSAPFFGVTLAAMFLGEPFGLLQLGAAGMLVLAIAFLFKDQHAHEHAHEPTAHTHWHRHDDGHHNHTHEEFPALGWHSHWHEHEPAVHAHPHWPDLHHRHAH